MSNTSKSPRTVAMVALAIGHRRLPRYTHRFSPKTFTQPQLFACLVLKAFFKTDYRGIVYQLRDNPTLCDDLKLRRIPHFTTLQKASRRLLRLPIVKRLIDAAVQLMMGRAKRLQRAAIDASGFESRRISPYFVRRRDRSTGKPTTSHYTRFPKLGLIGDCATHMVLAAHPTRGPTPDVHQLADTFAQLPPGLSLLRLLADAGYDSEANHRLLRETHGIISLIPPQAGRPSSNPATGKHRRLMQRLFRNRQRIRFGQRWQVETIFSMIKRNLGHALSAKTYWSQCRELLLLVLTHNVMILRGQQERFSTEQSPLVFPGRYHPDTEVFERYMDGIPS
jgi:hypothetical protein